MENIELKAMSLEIFQFEKSKSVHELTSKKMNLVLVKSSRQKI